MGEVGGVARSHSCEHSRAERQFMYPITNIWVGLQVLTTLYQAIHGVNGARVTDNKSSRYGLSKEMDMQIR